MIVPQTCHDVYDVVGYGGDVDLIAGARANFNKFKVRNSSDSDACHLCNIEAPAEFNAAVLRSQVRRLRSRFRQRIAFSPRLYLPHSRGYWSDERFWSATGAVSANNERITNSPSISKRTASSLKLAAHQPGDEKCVTVIPSWSANSVKSIGVLWPIRFRLHILVMYAVARLQCLAVKRSA